VPADAATPPAAPLPRTPDPRLDTARPHGLRPGRASLGDLNRPLRHSDPLSLGAASLSHGHGPSLLRPWARSLGLVPSPGTLSPRTRKPRLPSQGTRADQTAPAPRTAGDLPGPRGAVPPPVRRRCRAVFAAGQDDNVGVGPRGTGREPAIPRRRPPALATSAPKPRPSAVAPETAGPNGRGPGSPPPPADDERHPRPGEPGSGPQRDSGRAGDSGRRDPPGLLSGPAFRPQKTAAQRVTPNSWASPFGPRFLGPEIGPTKETRIQTHGPGPPPPWQRDRPAPIPTSSMDSDGARRPSKHARPANKTRPPNTTRRPTNHETHPTARLQV